MQNLPENSVQQEDHLGFCLDELVVPASHKQRQYEGLEIMNIMMR